MNTLAKETCDSCGKAMEAREALFTGNKVLCHDCEDPDVQTVHAIRKHLVNVKNKERYERQMVEGGYEFLDVGYEVKRKLFRRTQRVNHGRQGKDDVRRGVSSMGNADSAGLLCVECETADQ